MCDEHQRKDDDDLAIDTSFDDDDNIVKVTLSTRRSMPMLWWINRTTKKSLVVIGQIVMLLESAAWKANLRMNSQEVPLLQKSLLSFSLLSCALCVLSRARAHLQVALLPCFHLLVVLLAVRCEPRARVSQTGESASKADESLIRVSQIRRVCFKKRTS